MTSRCQLELHDSASNRRPQLWPQVLTLNDGTVSVDVWQGQGYSHKILPHRFPSTVELSIAFLFFFRCGALVNSVVRVGVQWPTSGLGQALISATSRHGYVATTWQ